MSADQEVNTEGTQDDAEKQKQEGENTGTTDSGSTDTGTEG